MKNTTYHSTLRIGALTFAVIILFDSGLLSPVTRQISQNTQDYLASAIGMYASIETTELNQMTAELTQQGSLLAKKESDLAAREIAVKLQEKESPSGGYSTYLMSIILFIILVLMVLNYALDYARARERFVQNNHEKVA
jgi:ABC-type transport system involved in cytochrome bd biosynthesis fused ATPase/permease subunit